jgi:glutathione S-transferase
VILVGQYDSPFVRRVAVSLHELGVAFERAALSVFADAAAMCAYNPLGRVPTLVLDDGEALIDSAAILDWLDEAVGPERPLLPAGGAPRRQALRQLALATGAAEKAVQLAYERKLRPAPLRWAEWIERVTGQATLALAALEVGAQELRPEAGRLAQPGITTACVWRYIQMATPDLVPAGRYPGLERHAAGCEARPAFRATWPAAVTYPSRTG